ncbi:MAG: hypothetical protein WC658_04725 [Candidatus Omnitrophota bacterium]
MPKNLLELKERRKYLRLDTVFPVQFRLDSLDGSRIISGWQQGFTNNLGKGGICLVAFNLEPEFSALLKNKQVLLSLEIEMPIIKRPVRALAIVMWTSAIPSQPNKLLVGLGYKNIDPVQNRKIMRYAWGKKLFVPVVLSVIFFLGLIIGINTFINARLTASNKRLVEQLVNVLQESSSTKEKIKEINRGKQALQLKISALETQIGVIEKEKALAKEFQTGRLKSFNVLLEKLSQERQGLKQEVLELQRKEAVVSEEVLRLDKKKTALEKINFEKMYRWLLVHQNARTGLVASFEGDKDIESWAFSYDQALAVLAYTYLGDVSAARKILGFFKYKAKRTQGRFLNAYYTSDGNPAEYIVHSGPNIWVGIAVVQYSRITADNEFMGLAEEIADTAINLQNQDKDGGIRGGPDTTWYATEHNLDAYAFFNMLYKVTGKSQYAHARDKVLQWLLKHTYDKADIPIKRGKGDATIATDTYAWSIAAIGPEKLQEVGMNPGKIMEFAEDNCSVVVDFRRPDGRSIKIKGFDFAARRNIARGGVVSSEWTAQMILSFNLMADFYYKNNMPDKAGAYKAKADAYMIELSNMIISSASASGQGEGCLPYATQDYVDTGHGWMTPKGSRTGSVSGTAYALFAYYKFNPLELKE